MATPGNLSRILLLHIVPGGLIFLVYLAATPVVTRLGLPRVSALLLSFVAVGIPLQLAIMKSHAASEGKKSLGDVIAFRRPSPLWLSAALVVASFGLAIGLLLVLPFDQIAKYLAEDVFWWFPAAAKPSTAATGVGSAVLVTLALQLLIDGIANPIVEELYFRGYLLPRMSRLGWLAPFVNTGLFALAHLWQPYNYALIFAMVLPLTLITWWRRNIYIQMTAHCLANTTGATISLMAYLREAP